MPRKPPRRSLDPILGAHPVEELDLHGVRALDAAPMVRGFLAGWRSRGRGTVVRIITGRGAGSPAGPVLKRKVAALLRTDLAAWVADWCEDESGGAFLVRLR